MKKVLLYALVVFPIYTYDVKKRIETDPLTVPLLIIGSGPAGYTAGIYARLAGIPTKLVAGPLWGGQLTKTTLVENYPGVKNALGITIPETMHEQAIELGLEMLEDIVTEVDLTSWPFVVRLASGAELHPLALIIATGATPRLLGVPGEDTYWGGGVSSCALCDCQFFKKKNVFVVGGGDAAIEEAIQLSAHAAHVTILVRKGHMRAVHRMQDKLLGYPTIRVKYNKEVKAIHGDGQGVTGLTLHDTQTGHMNDVQADGLFLAIGHTPNTELFKGQLALTQEGYIVLEGRTQATSVPLVYAAGDVEDSEYRQAIVAAGHGCKAAIECVSKLKTGIGLTDDVIKLYTELRAQRDPAGE